MTTETKPTDIDLPARQDHEAEFTDTPAAGGIVKRTRVGLSRPTNQDHAAEPPAPDAVVGIITRTNTDVDLPQPTEATD